jgi:hypothetical protein
MIISNRRFKQTISNVENIYADQDHSNVYRLRVNKPSLSQIFAQIKTKYENKLSKFHSVTILFTTVNYKFL